MNKSKHTPKKPKELDLRYAKPEVQSYIREQAIRLHEEGETNIAISRRFNVHQNTVCKWIKRYREEGLEQAVQGQKRGPKSKTRALLSESQKQQVLHAIVDKLPTDYNIQHSLWHSSSVRLLVEQMFQVKLAKSTMCRWLSSVGLSYQRPVKQAIQRDQEKVDTWLNETYPAIVKKAAKEHAVILWQDETSLCQDPNWVKGWGFKGQTPILKINPRNRYSNAVMQVAINNRGKLLFSIQSQAVTGEDFRDFLNGIRQEYGDSRKIIVICDNASIHKSKVVKEWLENDGHFELQFIPAYSPDLNPVEVFNQTLKIKMRMAPAMSKEQTQTFAREHAAAMQELNGNGVRKCFERESVKYATEREAMKHIAPEDPTSNE